jgi:hypothetical protein
MDLRDLTPSEFYASEEAAAFRAEDREPGCTCRVLRGTADSPEEWEPCDACLHERSRREAAEVALQRDLRAFVGIACGRQF